MDVNKLDVEGAQAAHPAVIHKMLSSVGLLGDKTKLAQQWHLAGKSSTTTFYFTISNTEIIKKLDVIIFLELKDVLQKRQRHGGCGKHAGCLVKGELWPEVFTYNFFNNIAALNIAIRWRAGLLCTSDINTVVPYQRTNWSCEGKTYQSFQPNEREWMTESSILFIHSYLLLFAIYIDTIMLDSSSNTLFKGLYFQNKSKQIWNSTNINTCSANKQIQRQVFFSV